MVAGRLTEICMSRTKGVAKDAVDQATLKANHGLVGDAHAGFDHRQVSLLSESDIATMRARGLELEPGAFGENLIIEGVDTGALGIGSRLRVGDAELEISQIGKECHDRCAIYYTTGDCIMPRQGLFAVVRSGGIINRDCRVRVTRARPRPSSDLPLVADETRS